MTFQQFYSDVYLPRHPQGICRLFHLLGPFASAAYLGVILWLRLWWLLPLAPLPNYLVAWLGHLAVGNRPTFFEHPVWSFMAYWKMIATIIRGRKFEARN